VRLGCFPTPPGAARSLEQPDALPKPAPDVHPLARGRLGGRAPEGSRPRDADRGGGLGEATRRHAGQVHDRQPCHEGLARAILPQAMLPHASAPCGAADDALPPALTNFFLRISLLQSLSEKCGCRTPPRRRAASPHAAPAALLPRPCTRCAAHAHPARDTAGRWKSSSQPWEECIRNGSLLRAGTEGQGDEDCGCQGGVRVGGTVGWVGGKMERRGARSRPAASVGTLPRDVSFSTEGGTRRIQLVRKEGRDVSS